MDGQHLAGLELTTGVQHGSLPVPTGSQLAAPWVPGCVRACVPGRRPLCSRCAAFLPCTPQTGTRSPTGGALGRRTQGDGRLELPRATTRCHRAPALALGLWPCIPQDCAQGHPPPLPHTCCACLPSPSAALCSPSKPGMPTAGSLCTPAWGRAHAASTTRGTPQQLQRIMKWADKCVSRGGVLDAPSSYPPAHSRPLAAAEGQLGARRDPRIYLPLGRFPSFSPCLFKDPKERGAQAAQPLSICPGLRA